MPEFFLEKERTKKKSAPSVADLEVGDIIMYDGARREIEEISTDRIKMKDLDAPDYGGILLGTSDNHIRALCLSASSLSMSLYLQNEQAAKRKKNQLK